MKKLRTFILIYSVMLMYLIILHFLSSDRGNARKSIKFLLKNFISVNDVKISILEIRNEDIIVIPRNIKDNKTFLEIFRHMLHRYVKEKIVLDNANYKFEKFVQVRIENLGDKNYEHAYDFAIDTKEGEKS